jgi:hypothetical protein
MGGRPFIFISPESSRVVNILEMGRRSTELRSSYDERPLKVIDNNNPISKPKGKVQTSKAQLVAEPYKTTSDKVESSRFPECILSLLDELVLALLMETKHES